MWISLSLIVLIIALTRFDGTPNSDVDEFQIFAMLALTFPSGYIVILLFSALAVSADALFSITIPTSYLELLLTWAAFFIA